MINFVFAAAAIVLAILFGDDPLWLRVAVLLAVWAALSSAFAVARSRREAANVAAREAEITRTYELELHREVAARREYEAALSAQVREQVQHKHDSDIAALRSQLERLTATLSQLLDGDVLVERLTLSAEATRVRGINDGGRLLTKAAARAELPGGALAAPSADPATEDPHHDAIDAELIDESVAWPDGSSVDNAAAVTAAPASGPRSNAPATGWTHRHRTDVLQAAATVAADRAAQQRAEEESRKAEELRRAEIAREVEEARLAEEARKIEEARLAEEAQQIEDARKIEEAQKIDEAVVADHEELDDTVNRAALATELERSAAPSDSVETDVQQPIPAMTWVPSPGPQMPWPPPDVADDPTVDQATPDGDGAIAPAVEPVPASEAEPTTEVQHESHQAGTPGRVSASDLLAAFGSAGRPRRRRRASDD